MTPPRTIYSQGQVVYPGTSGIAPGCVIYPIEAPRGTPQCGVCRGDGSIPDAVCVLPLGHEGPHYG